MSTQNAEYIPQQNENGNGHHNGRNAHHGHHNGNGNGNGEHKKIFSLVPATDNLTFAILDARDAALKDDRLSRSARACFCRLLDLSLNRNCNDKPGVVTISQPKLAETFGVSERTIYTWTQELKAARYLWTSLKFVTDKWPLLTYHVTAIDEPHHGNGRTDRDGTYGRNNSTKRSRPNEANGARKPGQTSLDLTGSKSRPEGVCSKSDLLQGISGETRQKDPVSPEEKIGCHPKKRSGVTRSQLPVSPEASFSLKEAQIGDQSLPEKGEGAKSPPVGGAGDGKIIGWDADFESWKAKLGKKYDRELREILKDLEGDRQRLKDFPTVDAPEKLRRLKLKLDAVRTAIKGPA